MQLWMAAVLFLAAAAGVVTLIVRARRSGTQKWTIAAIAALSIVMLALLLYAALTFIFLEAI